jgi:hypothetical protein
MEHVPHAHSTQEEIHEDEKGFEVPSFIKKTLLVGALAAGLQGETAAQQAPSAKGYEIQVTDPRLERENAELFNRIVLFEKVLKESIKKEGKSDVPRYSVLSAKEVMGRATYESEEVMVSVLKQDFEGEIINNQSGKYAVADRTTQAFSTLVKEKQILESVGVLKEAAKIFSTYIPLDYCILFDIDKVGDTYRFTVRKMNLKEKQIDMYTSEYTLTERDKKLGDGYTPMLKIVKNFAQEVVQ